MKLENQVVSLELSKKLKELGVKQESEFYWNNDEKYCLDTKQFELGFGLPRGSYTKDKTKTESENWLDGEIFSAFTVAELGEMFPDGLRLGVKTIKGLGGWHCELYSYEDMPYKRLHLITEQEEANSRAKMLIYLLENNLIKKDV